MGSLLILTTCLLDRTSDVVIVDATGLGVVGLYGVNLLILRVLVAVGLFHAFPGVSSTVHRVGADLPTANNVGVRLDWTISRSCLNSSLDSRRCDPITRWVRQTIVTRLLLNDQFLIVHDLYFGRHIPVIILLAVLRGHSAVSNVVG